MNRAVSFVGTATRTDIEDSKQAEARLTTLIDTIPANGRDNSP